MQLQLMDHILDKHCHPAQLRQQPNFYCWAVVDVDILTIL
jgi:hypothetical protein